MGVRIYKKGTTPSSFSWQRRQFVLNGIQKEKGIVRWLIDALIVAHGQVGQRWHRCAPHGLCQLLGSFILRLPIGFFFWCEYPLLLRLLPSRFREMRRWKRRRSSLADEPLARTGSLDRNGRSNTRRRRMPYKLFCIGWLCSRRPRRSA